MSSFTDEDRRQDAVRRQQQVDQTSAPATIKCIHCGLAFALPFATDLDNPICPVCL